MIDIKAIEEKLSQIITASMEGFNAKDFDFNCSDVVDDEYLDTLADEANTELWENGTLGRSLEHTRVVEFKDPTTHE